MYQLSEMDGSVYQKWVHGGRLKKYYPPTGDTFILRENFDDKDVMSEERWVELTLQGNLSLSDEGIQRLQATFPMVDVSHVHKRVIDSELTKRRSLQNGGGIVVRERDSHHKMQLRPRLTG